MLHLLVTYCSLGLQLVIKFYLLHIHFSLGIQKISHSNKITKSQKRKRKKKKRDIDIKYSNSAKNN